jgi:hypothetical protein
VFVVYDGDDGDSGFVHDHLLYHLSSSTTKEDYEELYRIHTTKQRELQEEVSVDI